MSVRYFPNSPFPGGDVFHNVTEIHYCYPSPLKELGMQIAFESDIHGTGCTRQVAHVAEFEAAIAPRKHKDF